MLSFHQIVASDFSAVNKMIVDELHSDVDLVENIGNYIVQGGGKRLRPLTVLLAAKACGYQGDHHIALATIVEFIHTATLLHDDVVDHSDKRRGRDTANALWGNSPTVLVGDFLYSRAFQLMVQLSNMTIMEIMAQTTNVIAEGEVQQLVNIGNLDIDESVYETTIFKKTAILFEAAAQAGAVLASAPDSQSDALAQYGRHLGMAFQLQDDVLDYQGDAAEMGKNLGDDLAEGKMTLPLIHAMAKGGDPAREIISTAFQQADTSLMADIQQLIQDADSLEYCYMKAFDHADAAKENLQVLPDTEYRKTLEDIADFSVKRSY